MFALCFIFSAIPFAVAETTTNNADQNSLSTSNGTEQGLKLGSTGDKVIEVQKWLQTQGYYSGSIDGSFGPDTETAVKLFQSDAKIVVDGYVSDQTLKAMIDFTSSGENSKISNPNSQSTGTISSSKNLKNNQKKSIRANTKTNYRTTYGKGTGDCWVNSANLYSQLSSSGQKARIVQYSTSLSSRHRSVQVYQNGAWVNYNYKANGYAKTYYATSNSVSGNVIK